MGEEFKSRGWKAEDNIWERVGPSVDPDASDCLGSTHRA